MTIWKEYKLSALMEIIGGGTPKTSVEEYWNGKIPWLSVVDFGNDNKFVENTEKKITDLGLKNSSTKLLKDGQIIISARGTVGEMAVVKGEMAFNQSCYGLDAKPEICTNNFLYYLLKCKINELKRNAHGAVFDTITRTSFDSIFAILPDLPTQTAIAEILSSLDDKIELNHKINQELENLAQTLFKQWFIDFEFPDENGNPYKASGGEMLESELGEIPIGWEVRNLNEITIDITRGFTTKYVEKSNLKNLNQKVNRGNYLDKSNFKYYPEDTNVPHNKFAKQKDILINSLGQGTLGRIHFYKEITNNVVVDQHITILRANENFILSELLFLMLTFSSNQERLESMVTGSTGMLMLNISKIREFKIVVSPHELQEFLKNNILSYFDMINNNVLENQELTKLRDTLLSKLISGELKVKDHSTQQS
ncbi:MAG: restriction endonuclease subunit S [Saprospiraceae bacterium]|nr:restriction endonuclease subunit S [Saprospiraceae bacterium]